MKQLPFLHLATSDEVATTHLLNPFELGCVFKLRFQLWENNTIPLEDNDNYLSRICNTTPKKFRLARANFDYLFKKENGNIFHISDREKWHQALKKSKVMSNNSLVRWNKDNANAMQKHSQLEVEVQSEQEPQLKLKPTDNGNEPRFDKSVWSPTWLIFNEKWKELPHKRGSLKKACTNYLSSKDDPNLDIPNIEELFVFYNNHQKQYADQPKYITSLDRYIDDCKWLEDTSFEIKQSLSEEKKDEDQDAMDRSAWETAKRIGRWFPAYKSEMISRCERKFGSITD